MKKIIFSIIFVFIITDFYSQTIGTKLEYEKKAFVYKLIGQDSIKSDFYRITNNKIASPLIVWIHGGGLMFGSSNSLPGEQLEFYLNAGYDVLAINYRLAPETRLNEIVEDIKDAFTWVHNNKIQLGIDTNRIFVIGHSAGAYLALMTGFVLKYPPRAIVSFYGYGDIQGEWCNKHDSVFIKMGLVPEEKALKLIRSSVITSARREERWDLYIFSRQQGIWVNLVSGHDPVKEPKYFDQFCPVKNMSSNYPPVLLIHGDKDTDVPLEQSELIDRELNNKNIEHLFIKASGFGHAFDRSEGGLGNPQISNIFNEVIQFMDKFK